MITYKRGIVTLIKFNAANLPRRLYINSPCKLDILVDGAGDHHGDNGVVPRAEEHKSQTQAHPQEGKSPAEQKL